MSDGLLNLQLLQLSFAHVLFDYRLGRNITFSTRSLTPLLRLQKLCGKKKLSKWSCSQLVLKQCLSITSSQHIRLMQPINYCKSTQRFAFRRGEFKSTFVIYFITICHVVICQSKTVKSKKKKKNPCNFSHSQTFCNHLTSCSCPPLPFTAKLWKFLAIFKKCPNFVAHNILWGFQRDVLMAQACFDVTALHRVGEWHAESKLLKWEPHWEHVNLMLCFSYSHWGEFPSFASTCEEFMIKSFASDKAGTQTVRGSFLGMFFIQSGCDSCWTCFSFSCGRVKAPARLLRLSCEWLLDWSIVLMP